MELNEVLQVINDGKLEEQNKSWLEEAANVLASNGKDAEAKSVVNVLQTKPFVSTDMFVRNAASIVENDNNSQKSNNLKAIFDKIEFVDENGKKKDLNLSQEVLDLAKLELAVELAEEEPLLGSAYQERLIGKMQEILSGMPVNQAAQDQGNNDQNLTNANLGAEGVANLFDPNFRGKVQIKVNQGLGGLFAARMGNVADQAQTLAQKYGQDLKDKFGKSGTSFFKFLEKKFNKVDSQLEQKLGSLYREPKAVVASMLQNGTWKEAALGIGLGAAAFIGAGTAVGVAASAGLTVMTAAMTGKRMKEFLKKFKTEQAEAKEKQEELSFWQFAGRNKKEVAKIILYTGATIAGGYAFASQVNALSNAGSAFGAAAAEAAQKASMSKMVLMTSGTATPFASDAAVAAANGDWETAKKSGKKALAVVGMAGLTYFVASSLGGGEAHAAETPAQGGHGDGNPFANTMFDENGHLNNPPVVEDVDQAPLAPGEHLPEQGGADIDGGADGSDAASATHYSVDKPSDSVQHFYENKLHDPKFISHEDVQKIMANMDNIEKPENMTDEMAINLARDERVWYHAGDLIDIQDVNGNPVVNVKGHIGSLITNEEGTFLKIGDTMGQQMVDSHGHKYFDFGENHHLYGTPKPAYLIDVMGCDEDNVNTEGYLKKLSESFVTTQGYHTPNGELRLLNAPTDPDYVMKGNFRHTVNVNGCDESTLTRHGGGRVTHNNEPAEPQHATKPTVKPDTLVSPAKLDTPMKTVEETHFNKPAEMVQIDNTQPQQEVKQVPHSKGGHYNSEGEFYNDNNSGKPAPKSTGRTYTVRGSYVGGKTR